MGGTERPGAGFVARGRRGDAQRAAPVVQEAEFLGTKAEGAVDEDEEVLVEHGGVLWLTDERQVTSMSTSDAYLLGLSLHSTCLLLPEKVEREGGRKGR